MSSSSPTAAASYYGQGPVLRLTRLGLALTQQLWPALAVRAKRAACALICSSLDCIRKSTPSSEEGNSEHK